MLLQTKTNKTVIRKSSGFFVSYFFDQKFKTIKKLDSNAIANNPFPMKVNFTGKCIYQSSDEKHLKTTMLTTPKKGI